MKKTLILFSLLSILFFISKPSNAQQYKLRQSTSISGLNTETTIYVKGMRKRTESGGLMGMNMPTTIEQCDKQRTIKLNDKKKLYFIEPFAKEEVIDEDAKPVVNKSKPVTAPVATKDGGTIHMWYNITDTGERKKMNGFTARHIWTTQKIKPSPDACTMKDSMIIKTDGWYIDLPEFNCPIRYSPTTYSRENTTKPECMDKYVSHRSGKGKLGFPLTETRTIIMWTGGKTSTEFKTDLQTVEFTSMKLDSMLFEIPPGYTETKNEVDLQDKMDVQEMMKQYKNNNPNNSNPVEKNPNAKKLGVYPPTGNDLQGSSINQAIAAGLTGGNVDAVSLSGDNDQKKFECDYLLSAEITKIKQASKVGGLIKAIKNADPNASSSFNIEGVVTLTNTADGSTRTQSISGKYEGKMEEAVRKAVEEGSRSLLKNIN